MFSGNSATNDGAGLAIFNASVLVEGCLFSGGSVDYGGGAIYSVEALSGMTTIRNCTIAGNWAGQYGGGICISNANCDIENTIIWGNCASWGDAVSLHNPGASVVFTCADAMHEEVEGNGTATWDAESIELDPLFCDPVSCSSTPNPEGDFTLASDSPCVASNSPCGIQIGALPVNCGPVATEAISWSQVKSLY